MAVLRYRVTISGRGLRYRDRRRTAHSLPGELITPGCDFSRLANFPVVAEALLLGEYLTIRLRTVAAGASRRSGVVIGILLIDIGPNGRLLATSFRSSMTLSRVPGEAICPILY